MEDVVRSLKRRKKTALASAIFGMGIFVGSICFVGYKSSANQKRELIKDLQINESPQLQRLNHLEEVFGVSYSSLDREISVGELRGFIPLKEVLGNPDVHGNYNSLFDELNSLRKTPSIIDETARNEYTRKEIQDRLSRSDLINAYVGLVGIAIGIPLLTVGAIELYCNYIVQREKLKKNERN